MLGTINAVPVPGAEFLLEADQGRSPVALESHPAVHLDSVARAPHGPRVADESYPHPSAPDSGCSCTQYVSEGVSCKDRGKASKRGPRLGEISGCTKVTTEQTRDTHPGIHRALHDRS